MATRHGRQARRRSPHVATVGVARPYAERPPEGFYARPQVARVEVRYAVEYDHAAIGRMVAAAAANTSRRRKSGPVIVRVAPHATPAPAPAVCGHCGRPVEEHTPFEYPNQYADRALTRRRVGYRCPGEEPARAPA